MKEVKLDQNNKNKTGKEIVVDLEIGNFVLTVATLTERQKISLDKSIWGEWR